MPAGISAKLNFDGAEKFKKDLKDMTARSKALSAQMNEMSTKFDKEGKSMGDNTKARKLANEQIEAQKQKIALLESGLKKLIDADQGESEAAYQVREQIAKANTALINMQHSSDKAADGQQNLTASMLKANLGAAAITTALKGAVTVMKSIVSAAGSAARAIWNLGVESGQWADSLITLSTQTGISTERLQEWSYAARFVDTDVSKMADGVFKVGQKMTNAKGKTKKYVEVTKKLKVAVRDANGHMRDADEVFLDVIDALGSITNEAERNKAAQNIFGKSYKDMIPLIEAGSGALRDYAAEAREVGAVISEDNVFALGAFDDQMQRFDATMQGIKTNLAVAFLPILQTVAERLTGFMGTVSKAISDGLQQEDVDTIVDAFFNMFRTEMTDESEGGNHDMTAGQFILALLKKFGEKIVANKETIKEKAGQIWEYIKEKFNEIRTDPTVQETLGAIGSTLGEAIVTGIKNGIKNGIKSIFSFDTSGTSNPMMARAKGLSNAQTGVLTGVFADEETVKGWGKDASSAYIEGLKTQSGPYEAEAKSYADALEKYLKTGVKTYDWGTEVGSGYADGMTSAQPEVDAAAQAEIDAVEEHTGPSAHSKSTHWGNELAGGYAAGIEQGIPKVSAAARKLAQAASGPLHFSRPDYGPLREVGEWGGEMIDQYVRGINRNLWRVSSAIGAALPNMGGSTTNYGGVTIVVNGAAGQDVNSLADIIMERLQSAVDRREAVFA